MLSLFPDVSGSHMSKDPDCAYIDVEQDVLSPADAGQLYLCRYMVGLLLAVVDGRVLATNYLCSDHLPKCREKSRHSEPYYLNQVMYVCASVELHNGLCNILCSGCSGIACAPLRSTPSKLKIKYTNNVEISSHSR